MSKVDFYIIPATTVQAVRLFVCRLANKAYEHQKTALLFVDDEATARQFDDLLWTFSDISFIPHQIASTAETTTPIIIDWRNDKTAEQDILINCATIVPNFAKQFDRIIEIAAEEPTWKQQARARYRFYKENDFEIQNHQLRK